MDWDESSTDSSVLPPLNTLLTHPPFFGGIAIAMPRALFLTQTRSLRCSTPTNGKHQQMYTILLFTLIDGRMGDGRGVVGGAAAVER